MVRNLLILFVGVFTSLTLCMGVAWAPLVTTYDDSYSDSDDDDDSGYVDLSDVDTDQPVAFLR